MSHPIKYGGKLFMGDGGQIALWVNLLGECSTWRVKWLDQLPIMKGYTLEDKALISQQNCGSIYS